MTFIQTIINPNNIWVCSDNRTSSRLPNGTYKTKDDNNTKHVSLHCPDGTGLLIYTGIAELTDHTKTSDWVREIIRGETRSLEETVAFITNRACDEFKGYISQLIFLIPSYINDAPYFFKIQSITNTSGSINNFRISKKTINEALYFSDGIGSDQITANENQKLQKIVRNNPRTIEEFTNLLIEINQKISLVDKETVSESCIVAVMPKTGEPVNITLHKTFTQPPSINFGVDNTELMQFVNEKNNFDLPVKERNKLLEEIGKRSVKPRS